MTYLRAWFPLVTSLLWLGALGGCEETEPPVEPGMPVEDLCAEIVEIACNTDTRCCDATPRDCAETQRLDCDASIQPLLDDPRLAYDPLRGGALVESMRERAETCWEQPVDYGALADVFAGTGGDGSDCTPPTLDESALRISALSCADGLACRLHLDAASRPQGVCEARTEDDDACSHALDCPSGRFCDLPEDWTPGLWGTCRPLRVDGWTCVSDQECASRHCDDTCGPPPASTRCLATPYDALVLESSPIAYLRFDERSGTRAEDAAGEHAGVLTSAVTRDSDSPIGSEAPDDEPALDGGVPDAGLPDAGLSDAGVSDAAMPDDGGALDPDGGPADAGPPDAGVAPAGTGGSLRFSSDEAAVRVPALEALAEATTVSFECWIRLDGAEAVGPVLEVSDGVEAGAHVWVFDTGSEIYANLIDTESAAHVIETEAGTLSAGAWHHVAVTVDGETGRLYLDGRRVGQVAVGALRLDGDLYVGHRPSGETPVSFRGAIDEVAVYDHALDAATVARHHAAGLAGVHTRRFSLFRWLQP